MQVQVLGSSSGTPTRSRNVSAYAVFRDDQKPWYLVDCGEATQHQILRSKLSLYHLEAVFITHKHGDHCYGLPGLIASAGLSGRTHSMRIVAPVEVLEFVRAAMAMSEWSLPFNLELCALERLNEQAFSWVEVQSCPLQHRVPSYGFKFTEIQIPRKLAIDRLQAQHIASGPHYNLLQRGEDVSYQGRLLSAGDYTYLAWQPRVIIVCGDNEAPTCLDPVISGVHLLVHEATFLATDLRKVGVHTGHSDVQRVSAYGQEHKLPALLLTHFSARYAPGEGMKPLFVEAKAEYSGRLFLATDGMIVEVAKNAEVVVVQAGFSKE
ncbi:ribonuclease Z [Pseudoalteromonas sp. BDTF-M6]|uniref:ribonuclease Z n=1 Tax=Pseudoalteromonas sp. BDTF-M6 TaxID=2796132 RepID=UPI001BB0AF9C|nr:ribonuclease Z [Pseudoalteromonas sp. BDTF-M6]